MTRRTSQKRRKTDGGAESADEERKEHHTCDGCGDGIQIYTLSADSPRDEFLKVEEWGDRGTPGPPETHWFCSWNCAALYATDRNEFDPELVTDGGELPDDHSIRCYDCERVVDRRHVDFVEVPVDNEDGPGYEYVPVPLCKDCRLRRYGVECQHCGGYHWDIEGVVECERDRPSMLPDGGQDAIDREELRDLLAEIAIEGNEQYKANMSNNANRPYRRGVGSGKTEAVNEVADYFDLELAYAEKRDLRAEKERGRAPDARDIDDLVAIDVCPHCRAEPAVVIVTRCDDECYHCGGVIR